MEIWLLDTYSVLLVLVNVFYCVMIWLFCAFACFAVLYLARLNQMLPQRRIGKERLVNVSMLTTLSLLCPSGELIF